MRRRIDIQPKIALLMVIGTIEAQKASRRPPVTDPAAMVRHTYKRPLGTPQTPLEDK